MFEHIIKFYVQAFEANKTLEHCPEGNHVHWLSFDLIFREEVIPSDIKSVKDDLIDSITLPENWTLHLLAETMYNELKARFVYLEKVTVCCDDNRDEIVSFYV